MKVIVIGGGLIGLTTAYTLGSRGHEITVIERGEGPGLETSFANGGLLTPSMSDPWNAPGSWRVLLASLARSDPPLQLRLRALPGLAGWGIRFLKNSRPATFERNTLRNLRLALYSLEVMRSLRQQTGIEYGRAARGSLKIFRDRTALERTFAAASRLSCEGMTFRKLSPQKTVALEPALAPIARDLAGAIHYHADETGDAYRFCVALADLARRQGVEFRFGTTVTSLQMRSGRVSAIATAQGRFEADRYLVAAGSYSTPLLKNAGISLPVRPAKGYSVSFPVTQEQNPLSIPLIDDDLHAAVVPLEGVIRIAGTAEFTGYDRALNPPRVLNLLRLLQDLLPQLRLDPAHARAWCGLRPTSADGVPIIGSTPIANLWLSTGHGHLGWTMAAGSAQLLSDLICGDRPAIDPVPFALARFIR